MRMRRAVASSALAGLMVVGVATGPASAAVPERDPERYSSTAVVWGYAVSDKDGIDTWLNQSNGRAIDVEPWGSGGFSVVSVNNNNPAYTRTPGGSFSWTTHETGASLSSKISANPHKRLIDLERHTVGGETRFAAAWVDNTGEAAKSWWWWLNVTPATIAEKLSDCGCRLIDLDPIGGGRYDAIMIPNSGVDGLAWWWYHGITELQAYQYLAENQARPVDLEPDGSGRFAVLMVRDGLRGGMRVNQTWNDLNVPSDMRFIHVKNYTNTAGASVWLSVYLQNG